MVGYEALWTDIGWWLFPLAMTALCFFIMRGRRFCMTGWSTSRSGKRSPSLASSESAKEILDKRYVLGEISKEEYQEKRVDIGQTEG
jgi:uncharacterized membrane protein